MNKYFPLFVTITDHLPNGKMRWVSDDRKLYGFLDPEQKSDQPEYSIGTKLTFDEGEIIDVKLPVEKVQ